MRLNNTVFRMGNECHSICPAAGESRGHVTVSVALSILLSYQCRPGETIAVETGSIAQNGKETNLQYPV